VARAHSREESKKGNQWYFGMKAHIGVDADSGLVHTLVTTAGNISDISQTHALLHGEEAAVHLDAGYTGIAAREEILQAQAEGRIAENLTWHVAAKRGWLKAMADGPVKASLQALETAKARIRSWVEHPFHVVKNQFGYRKVRYVGLAKNTAQQFTLFALANLVLAQRRSIHGSVAP